MRKPTVEDCRIIDLGKIEFDRGNLTVVQARETVPFDIKRVFYLYDIPGGEARGAHAHKECHQFLVAASGSFEVVLDDGHETRTVYLNRPFKGLHIPPGIWATEKNYSEDVLYLVLASDHYDEADYFRCYEDFIRYKHDSLS